MNERYLVVFLTALLLSATLGACDWGDGAQPQPPGVVLESELSRDLNPDVTQEEVDTLMKGNIEFAMESYHELRQGAVNLFYSPLSISQAMAMAYGGARGETEAQMAAALSYQLPQHRLHPAMNWLDLELARRGQGALGVDGSGFRLNITNGMFAQRGFSFRGSYLDLLAQQYGNQLALLDFMDNVEGARQAINSWVAERTGGRISELFAQGTIPGDTRLVLANAVYFNAAWETPFTPERTSQDTFYTPSGEVTVPMMRGRIAGMESGAGAGYQAVSLPYDGSEIDMVIIMPEADTFSTFEGDLDATVLNDILGSLNGRQHDVLRMPRFELRSQLDLVETFQALGLVDAFTENASFSGMTEQEKLQISGVVHEAFVKVNEAGTEAAAATGVVAVPTSVPTVLTIDRPFIFLIRDVSTGAVLFLGRVVDPTA